MVVLKGFEVAIVVNGHDLTEYIYDKPETENNDIDESYKITRYIEAKAGETFAIRSIAQENFCRGLNIAGIQINHVFDGTVMSAASHNEAPYETFRNTIRVYKKGRWFAKSFKFADITIGRLLYWESFKQNC